MKILLSLVAAFAISGLPLVTSNQLRRAGVVQGRTLQGNDTEIWNGSPVAAGEFPAFALICFNFAVNNCAGCGGVLITSQHVLTAGHCQPSSITGVRIGASQSQGDGTYVAVASAARHPDYIETSDPFSLVNDVAILTLASPVTDVTPLSYNKNPFYTDYFGDSLTVIGYGSYQAGTGSVPNSDYLRKTTVFSQTDSACANAAVNTFGVDWYSSTAMFCTYASNTGTCRGDSGGPVIDNNGLVWGVLSWGGTDCALDSGDFWTEVATYSSWIETQTGGTGTAPSTPRPTPVPTPAPTPFPVLPPVPDDDCNSFADDSFWGKATQVLQSFGILGDGL